MQNDDDKQQSPERLNERRHERVDRSFFDWLNGEQAKKESAEERLRKKLDKELKVAAKKRAEQFEKERRVEEKREVSETRKLKKRWRAKLVESSKQRLEQAETASAEPTDGYTIARLMVAERIVALHDMLTSEDLDLRRSEIKALKIHIDFMGLLSEKLDRPELDVPEEIEQLYKTIASSARETVEKPQSPPETTLPETPAPPESDHETAYRVFAASIVETIRRTLRPTPKPSVELASDYSPASEAAGEEQLPYKSNLHVPERLVEKTPDRLEPDVVVPIVTTATLIAMIRKEALPANELRQEIRHAETIRRLAEVVEQVETISKMVPTNTVEKLVKPTPIETVRQATASQALDSTTAPDQVATVQPETTRTETALATTQPAPAEYQPAPKPADIDQWSETDLLDTARTVYVGSGRYLAELYQNGEIDRTGLVKVLKSYLKQRDYLSEFRRQREAYRRRRSPEILAETSDRPTPYSNTSPPKTTELEPPELPQPKISKKPALPKLTRSFARISPKELSQKKFKRQASLYLFLASILLVVALVGIGIAIL